MSDQEKDLQRIREYILNHEEFFCGPDGLGWNRPGGLPQYYLNHRDEWSLDLARVERLKREKKARDAAASRGDQTVSTGMSPETRQLLDSIRDMAGRGVPPAAIAENLGLQEQAVRNVLAMGQRAYEPASAGPALTAAVDGFLRTFGRTWQTGDNGNGNGHIKENGPV